MNKAFTILLVEDDENDVLLLKRAIRKVGISIPVQLARDGMEALNYLQGTGKFGDRAHYPFPDVVLLDLKIPRLSGLELLAWLNDHQEFRIIPTIVLSSSQLEEDVRRAYELGASTYLVKPSDVETLTKMVKSIHDYWALGVKPSVVGSKIADIQKK